MSAEHELLRRAYAAYNAQDLAGLLALICEDVDWPDGTVGRLRGKAEVRSYWLRQWVHTRTHDQPVTFVNRPDGRIAVHVDQAVRTPDGALISTASFCHVHRVKGSQISRLDIEPARRCVDAPVELRQGPVTAERSSE